MKLMFQSWLRKKSIVQYVYKSILLLLDMLFHPSSFSRIGSCTLHKLLESVTTPLYISVYAILSSFTTTMPICCV